MQNSLHERISVLNRARNPQVLHVHSGSSARFALSFISFGVFCNIALVQIDEYE